MPEVKEDASQNLDEVIAKQFDKKDSSHDKAVVMSLDYAFHDLRKKHLLSQKTLIETSIESISKLLLIRLNPTLSVSLTQRIAVICQDIQQQALGVSIDIKVMESLIVFKDNAKKVIDQEQSQKNILTACETKLGKTLSEYAHAQYNKFLQEQVEKFYADCQKHFPNIDLTKLKKYFNTRFDQPADHWDKIYEGTSQEFICPLQEVVAMLYLAINDLEQHPITPNNGIKDRIESLLNCMQTISNSYMDRLGLVDVNGASLDLCPVGIRANLGLAVGEALNLDLIEDLEAAVQKKLLELIAEKIKAKSPEEQYKITLAWIKRMTEGPSSQSSSSSSSSSSTNTNPIPELPNLKEELKSAIKEIFAGKVLAGDGKESGEIEQYFTKVWERAHKFYPPTADINKAAPLIHELYDSDANGSDAKTGLLKRIKEILEETHQTFSSSSMEYVLEQIRLLLAIDDIHARCFYYLQTQLFKDDPRLKQMMASLDILYSAISHNMDLKIAKEIVEVKKGQATPQEMYAAERDFIDVAGELKKLQEKFNNIFQGTSKTFVESFFASFFAAENLEDKMKLLKQLFGLPKDSGLIISAEQAKSFLQARGKIILKINNNGTESVYTLAEKAGQYPKLDKAMQGNSDVRLSYKDLKELMDQNDDYFKKLFNVDQPETLFDPNNKQVQIKITCATTDLTLFDINQVLLNAITTPLGQWSQDFFDLYTTILDFIKTDILSKDRWVDARGAEVKRDSYPAELIAILEDLKTCYTKPEKPLESFVLLYWLMNNIPVGKRSDFLLNMTDNDGKNRYKNAVSTAEELIDLSCLLEGDPNPNTQKNLLDVLGKDKVQGFFATVGDLINVLKDIKDAATQKHLLDLLGKDKVQGLVVKLKDLVKVLFYIDGIPTRRYLLDDLLVKDKVQNLILAVCDLKDILLFFDVGQDGAKMLLSYDALAILSDSQAVSVFFYINSILTREQLLDWLGKDKIQKLIVTFSYLYDVLSCIKDLATKKHLLDLLDKDKIQSLFATSSDLINALLKLSTVFIKQIDCSKLDYSNPFLSTIIDPDNSLAIKKQLLGLLGENKVKELFVNATFDDLKKILSCINDPATQKQLLAWIGKDKVQGFIVTVGDLIEVFKYIKDADTLQHLLYLLGEKKVQGFIGNVANLETALSTILITDPDKNLAIKNQLLGLLGEKKVQELFVNATFDDLKKILSCINDPATQKQLLDWLGKDKVQGLVKTVSNLLYVLCVPQDAALQKQLLDMLGKYKIQGLIVTSIHLGNVLVFTGDVATQRYLLDDLLGKNKVQGLVKTVDDLTNIFVFINYTDTQKLLFDLLGKNKVQGLLKTVEDRTKILSYIKDASTQTHLLDLLEEEKVRDLKSSSGTSVSGDSYDNKQPSCAFFSMPKQQLPETNKTTQQQLDEKKPVNKPPTTVMLR